MTLQELAGFDGRDGRRAYIAYKGKVYDVSESPLWRDGEHQGMHRAGADLTDALSEAPHGDEVFARFPAVGRLEDFKASAYGENTTVIHDDPKSHLRAWYRKYHPHPMAVHFPIALHLFAAGADLIFLFTHSSALAVSVFYTFFVATVMGAAAMIPGILSWWINYGFAMRRPFIIKAVLSVVMLLVGIVDILLYLENPSIVYETSIEGLIYHAIVLLTGIGVIVLGYYGGKITWGDAFTAEPPAATEKASQEEKSMEEENRSDAVTLQRAGEYALPFMRAADTVAVTLPEQTALANKQGKSVAVLIGGAAGQGIDTLEQILNSALRRSGYYVFSGKEFMSRVRGGSNTVLIRISDTPVEAACWEVDLFIALDAAVLKHAAPRLGEATLVITDEAYAGKREGAVGVPLKADAKALGSPRYENTYAAGIIYGLFGLEVSALQSSAAERFETDQGNTEAVKQGAERGGSLSHASLPPLPEVSEEAKARHLMDGTTACGFGFLAGGCNFVASYPMSPSTGVLNFMAAQSKNFEIAVEQSEDEIASLHFVLGAWYAGARALTTTSGGGFALMGEALSLSGMSETPAVIYLAQRPGPATGLPTRSEQGDLNLALHSGHGPFPRILLAPGSLHECITLGYLAFELADRHQVPVVVMSDEYLADTTGMVGTVDFAAFEQRRYLVQSNSDYRRYEETQDGVSPRSAPGFGAGLVCAVSDEHDERGQITEDYAMRDRMVAKRQRKGEGIMQEILPPERLGEGNIAVIGWGSTRGAIGEALARLGDARLMQVHFMWVHPLDPQQLDFLKNCEKRIVVENNADGAFAERLRLHGVIADGQVLQSNGFAFFADQLAQRLETILKEIA